ncbi:MAG TPA: kelch repeat-containing protein [Puia sp.]|nr:kelch repeat-containing protein [Puia sp.]
MRNQLPLAILICVCLAACTKNTGPTRPVITGFSPAKGAAGTTVTIHGHFDTTMQPLAVAFNGAQAQLFSSSDSQLVVIAPAGVTTGKIKVTENNLSTASDSNFFVLAGTWTQMMHIPQPANTSYQRWLGVGFAIGNYGYMGFGTDNGGDYSDLYQYDPLSNTWTQKKSLGLGIDDLVSLVIANKAYVGIGKSRDLSINTQQFYQYDPSTDTWTRKADFPGAGRQAAFAFSIGGIGYVALGDGSPSPGAPYGNYYDVWQYDPSTDTWTRKADFPTGNAYPNYGAAFSPDDRYGYVVGGGDLPSGSVNTAVAVVWRYDPATDKWTQMHNLPTTGMLFASAMVLNGTAYILGGGQECWRYDAASDSWTQVAFFGTRMGGSAFAINGKGYFGMGEQYFSHLPYKDLWQFTP